jgi:hypothetical protein
MPPVLVSVELVTFVLDGKLWLWWGEIIAGPVRGTSLPAQI